MILDYKRFVESVIVRDKGQEIFDYKSMVENAWREVVREAMDFYNIHSIWKMILQLELKRQYMFQKT